MKLGPKVGPMDSVPPKQGDSKEATTQELNDKTIGIDAEKKAGKKMPTLKGQGKVNNVNFTTVVDPTTVITQKTSAGNVTTESVDQDDEALTEEDQAEIDAMVEKFNESFDAIAESLNLSEEEYDALYKKTMTKFIADILEETEEAVDVNELYALWRPKENAATKKGVVSSKKKKASEEEKKAKKKKVMEDFKADMNTMLSGEEASLSEDFKSKVYDTFEAVVEARVNSLREELEEEAAESAADLIEEFSSDLLDRVDSYLSTVAEMWMENNEAAIVSQVKSDVTESFINGLKNLFLEHNIEIPEEKVDVLETVNAEKATLEVQIAEAMKTISELQEKMIEVEKSRVLAQVSEGLAESHREKLVTLSEGVVWTDEASYAQKIETIKATFLEGSKKTGQSMLTEEVDAETEQMMNTPVNNMMDEILRVISSSK